MVTVENVIQKLVNEFEFVVIPGFGALLSRQVPATYDDISGTYSPPSKRLAFNEYVKLDDGLLANYISRHEKVSHTDALAYINTYTSSLREALEKEGVARIDGIGSFVNNEEGKLIFEPGSRNYFKDDWYGFHKIDAKPVEPRALTPQAVATEEAEVVYLDLVDETEATVKRNWGGWIAAAVVSGFLLYFSFFLVTGRTENRSNLNPFSYLHSDSEKVNEVKPEVKKAENPAPVAVKKTTEPDSITSDWSALEVTKTVTTTPAAVQNETVDAGTKEYYVIAGAFKGTKQAGVLLEEMKKKGYSNAILIPGNEFSTKVKVAVEGFNNEADAHAASDKLKSVIGEKGWVYHKK